jgi:hypothetical protein
MVMYKVTAYMVMMYETGGKVLINVSMMLCKLMNCTVQGMIVMVLMMMMR